MNLVPLEQTYTANDTYTESPPANADGFSNAVITVNVPSPLPISIDRLTHIGSTYLLRNFTHVSTLTTVTIPVDYGVVSIFPRTEDVGDVWNIFIEYNSTGSGLTFNVAASGYYYFVPDGYGVFRFTTSDGKFCFAFPDSSTSDTQSTYVTVSRSLFNFDFSS